MSCVEFGPSLLPELREILLSTGNAYSYGAPGELVDVREEPFLGTWRLRSLTYDKERGKGRVVCVLSEDGKEVTATIDASDFPRMRRNSTRTTVWNGSMRYHDLAVKASVLIQEQIITKDPAAVPSQDRIQDPSHRIPRSLPMDPRPARWWSGGVVGQDAGVGRGECYLGDVQAVAVLA